MKLIYSCTIAGDEKNKSLKSKNTMPERKQHNTRDEKINGWGKVASLSDSDKECLKEKLLKMQKIKEIIFIERSSQVYVKARKIDK